MNQKVFEVMTPSPATCRMDEPIRQAVQIMRDKDCGVVPIVDQQNKCAGIITDRDVCLEVVLNNKSPQEPVSTIAHTNVISCTPNDSVEQVIQKMKQHQIRRIPVVDEQQRVVGIMAQKDVALQTDEKKTSELVGAVSR